VELFALLNHTVMTTSSHRYSRHRLELWSEARKVDFIIYMCYEAGQVWVLAALTRPGAEHITMVAGAGDYLSTHMPEEGPPGDSGALHALRGGRWGPVQCYGCQKLGHVISNCPHRAEGAGAQGATLTYNWPSVLHQRTDTSAQEMARAIDVNQRLEKASAAERRVAVSTKKRLFLCDRVDLVCGHAPGEAAAGSSARAVHTLSLPPVYKCIGWQMDGQAEQWVHLAIYKEVMKTRAVGLAQVAGRDDAAGMARAMEAARRCEIVADTTQAINADWGKIHNLWDNALPRQVKHGGEGQ